MKRIILAVSAAMLLAAAVFAAAPSHSSMGHMAGEGGKAGTWKGEILDSGCFLAHNAMGAKHKECAMRCASNGMPMLMLVDGKAVLLTPNHDDDAPYMSLKGLAGSVVEVTGTMYTRSGMTGIDVTGAKAVK